MIVRNEEKNLKRCLKSIKEFASEIIAVDTGSTDASKSILKEFGAQVFDYEWDGDFAAARNYGISKANGHFILFLDADEKLELHKPHLLKKYLGKSIYDIIPIGIVNFYGEKPDIRHSHFSGGLRLVRNNAPIGFINKIHEKINIDGKTIDYTNTVQRHIRILHYGYMKQAFKRKENRNTSLIMQEPNKVNDDAWTNYYLSAEYYSQGKTELAYNRANKAILLFIKNGIKPPALVYKLKYDLLITKHNSVHAYNGIVKAITLYPDYVDLHFYKGILQYANKEYTAAKKTFAYCLVLGELNLNHLIMAGSGSFLALYYLGLCYQKLGQPEEALHAFRQANTLYPNLHKQVEFKYYLQS